MPMEVIVGPAMRASNRRPPKRLTKNAADHGANRTGDQKAGSGASADRRVPPVRR
jgi:hypothetical protein